MSENGKDFKEYFNSYCENAQLYFGKYKNTPMKDIPKEYLIWVKGIPKYKEFNKSLKKAINKNIKYGK